MVIVFPLIFLALATGIALLISVNAARVRSPWRLIGNITASILITSSPIALFLFYLLAG